MSFSQVNEIKQSKIEETKQEFAEKEEKSE